MNPTAMQHLGDFHHYRADAIDSGDRVALCERRVIDLLLTSQLSDEARESSVAFELKHHHSVAQFGRVLSQKRRLPLDVCTAGALLHDIHVIQHGSYADHAHLGAPLALELLRDIGGFDAVELERVHTIVYHHSDKHVWSTDPLAEFGKDADVLDCFLYPGAFDYYLRHKSLESFSAYLKRARDVWSELTLPEDPRFGLLNGFNAGWFDRRQGLADHQVTAATLSVLERLAALGVASPLCPPPFAVHRIGRTANFFTNGDRWDAFAETFGAEQAAVSDAFAVDATKVPDLHRIIRLDPSIPSAASALCHPLKLRSVLVDAACSTGDPVLVWPALARFEVLSPDASSSPRTKELGI